MKSSISFQSIQPQSTLSSELRSVIRDNVLQFYMRGQKQDAQEEGITALYERGLLYTSTKRGWRVFITS